MAMNNVSVSVEEKKQIVNNCLKQINGQIYNAEINIRVSKKVGASEDGIKKAIDALVDLEKTKDGYSEILKELDDVSQEAVKGD